MRDCDAECSRAADAMTLARPNAAARQASEKEIRTAYKREALKWHPDRRGAPHTRLSHPRLLRVASAVGVPLA